MKCGIGLESENKPTERSSERNNRKRSDPDLMELVDEIFPFPWFFKGSPYRLSKKNPHFSDLLQKKQQKRLSLTRTHFMLRKLGIPYPQIARTLG